MRFYGLGFDEVGRLDTIQLAWMMDGMGKIAEAEGGGGAAAKPVEQMTAQERIEYYKQQGRIG